MRVLFVGEGPNDIGRPDSFGDPSTCTGGVVPILARSVQPAIAPDSIALRWSELHRFDRDAAKKGFPKKVVAAALIASRRYGCDAVICVADRDGDPERMDRLNEGREKAQTLLRCVVGLAVESIEAWTLGAPEAIAEELGLPVKTVRGEYPKGVDVERLLETSGKEDHKPKSLLRRITQLANRGAGQDFRDAVAERTDVAGLALECPQGFARFRNGLRQLTDGAGD